MFPGLVGSYCSYLLPKQAVGTSKIQVNPAQLRDHQNHPAIILMNCASVREALQVRAGGRRPHQEVRPALPHPEPDLRRTGMMMRCAVKTDYKGRL